MSARRKEVFIEKVLKKLYPGGPSFPKVPVPTLPTETSPVTAELQQKDSETIKTSATCARQTDEGKEISNQQKFYTVSLPPADYFGVTPTKSNATESENAESDEDDDGQESPEHLKRRRTRKKRKKSTLHCSNDQTLEHTDVNKHLQHLQEDLSGTTTECPKISENRKRKLKKKRQKEKLKASGLLVKATSVDFMYQPEEAENEASDLEDMDRKASEIQDFLQATQEIYFTDSISKSEDLSLKSVSEILQLLETRKIASSDVTFLHQLKSLIVLQDTERFNSTLKDFEEHSTMTPEHRRVVCSLFHYWVTDILPVKNRK